MRRLAYAFMLLAACMPEATTFDNPISPAGGGAVGKTSGNFDVDASTEGGDGDGGVGDGGTSGLNDAGTGGLNDAGTGGFNDGGTGGTGTDGGAADAPPFPEGDQIP